MLTTFDAWLAKTIFVRPIIKLCELTRQSQFAVSRLFWFIAVLDGFYHADTLLSSIIFGLLSLVVLFMASLHADTPTRSFIWTRMIALLLLIIDIGTGVAAGAWAGVELWFFVLVAEYAATIRTTPPLADKRTGVTAAEAG